jgi:hypothetical protein
MRYIIHQFGARRANGAAASPDAKTDERCNREPDAKTDERCGREPDAKTDERPDRLAGRSPY